MVMLIEAEAPGSGPVPRRAGDVNLTEPGEFAVALVAALEQALQAADRLLAALGSVGDDTAHAARPTSCAGPDGLSRREAEVLRLVARGRSTRQIAAALCLSPRTVQRHVANAYLKIGAHNRAEATAYVLRHGLA
jgi:DNA-binding NarL/FixJ family response regulator